MIERIPMSAGQEKVVDLARRDLILDSTYQRGSVWGAVRQRNLIRSLLSGIPVGNVFLNYRLGTHNDAVVDGKQRIEAVRAFLDARLTVPAEWFGEEPGMVNYDELTDTSRHIFARASITVQQTEFTLAEEKGLFGLINFGGIPQGESDNV